MSMYMYTNYNDLIKWVWFIFADSDPDGVWNKLTETEKRQFHQMFQNGTLAELVLTMPPWWETTPRIQELNQATPISKTTPIIPPNIPKLSSLIKVHVMYI